ncbi:STN and carboxypeptidase regulatory-like domain-containing protein [Spirosoma oryzicola]|uniref:STN and carboxypeptidase regulatory-like domain-containing protein n=1 Tax=Spirosoma oryzicola TaxID=2898794 RepID=UPI001E31A3EE|nr:STN and carboxypeptidase regulatory-like domain-containing protein [Spirosoma oryzicola]UHG93566.1 STN domain-containing protein [Spirosoma oryzicola]
MTLLRSCISLFFFCSAIGLRAQSAPPLERLITVDIRNQRVEEALRQISTAGHFAFSYNPAHIDKSAVVSVRLTNGTVRQVLNQVFANGMTFKSRGNHVILLRVDPTEPTPKNLLLDGYILDEQTGKRIAQASIFEKTTLASTVSNPFGYYRIKLPADLPSIRLDVRKQAYVRETVTIRGTFTHTVNVRLKPLPQQISVETIPIRITDDTTRSAMALAVNSVPVEMPAMVNDTTPEQKPWSIIERGRIGIMNLFVSTQQAIHDINLSRDTLYRDWQVSLVPYIGTNHRLSGRIINRLSFNALVGYSFGVRSFEVGGLLNLVQADVHGFQAGGLGNLVGRNVTGAQFGGLFNVAGGQVNGFQAGGLFTVNLKQASGVQVGGLFNATLGDQPGMVQIGGLLNFAGGSIDGVQLAGLVNYARNDVRGWQIGGLLNRARTVTRGHQIGLINLADSVEKVPIGLFSHVRKGGYRRIEVATGEVNLLNVAYRTGVRRFYNIFTAGTSFERIGSPTVSAGYGLGTAFTLSRRTMMSLEATAHHLFYNRGYYENNQQIRLGTLIETRFSKHLSLAFGPSVNWYFSEDEASRPVTQPTLSLFDNRVSAFGSTYLWGWIGFQAGLRFGNS